MTNREYIQSLSDEEFAKYLQRGIDKLKGENK